MCLTTFGNTKANRKCATRDIVCYKVFVISLDDFLQPTVINSMYHRTNVPWKIGVTKTAEKSPFIYCGEVKGGYFHSYRDWVDAQQIIKRGDGTRRLMVFKCVIPKGTWYYTGIHSDGFDGYASKQLRIVGAFENIKV